MRARYNYYNDYKGERHGYLMCSDYDTPDKREARSKLNALKKCGLTTCYKYKECDLNQQKSGNVKCINYKHFLK